MYVPFFISKHEEERSMYGSFKFDIVKKYYGSSKGDTVIATVSNIVEAFDLRNEFMKERHDDYYVSIERRTVDE